MEYLSDVSLNSYSNGKWPPKLLRIDNALPNMEYHDKILTKVT